MPAVKLQVAFLLLFLSALAVADARASALSGVERHLPFTLLPAHNLAAGCRGSVGECLAGDELDLDGGGLRLSHGRGRVPGRRRARRRRRASAPTQPRALLPVRVRVLRRDRVPCSRRGASYYNCPGQPIPPRQLPHSRVAAARLKASAGPESNNTSSSNPESFRRSWLEREDRHFVPPVKCFSCLAPNFGAKIVVALCRTERWNGDLVLGKLEHCS
ncbi:hypothetical protein EJB05_26161, partial [Eragrostis curvula]